MAVSNKQAKKDSSKQGIIQFFKELKAEFKRITWASKEDVKKALIAVLVFCGIYIIYVSIIDMGFIKLYNLIFK